MKYFDLLQIAKYFSNFKELKFIKRIADNEFLLHLDTQYFIINLEKGKSAIYTSDKMTCNYNAPFDVVLKKKVYKAALEKVEVLENNRVLVFTLTTKGAYKSNTYKIYFEFTGKHTNLILTDENDIVIESLRHILKSYRVVKVGQKLTSLKPFLIQEKEEKIQNFAEYFEAKGKMINEKNTKEFKKIKEEFLLKKIEAIDLKLSALMDSSKLLNLSEKAYKKADLLGANLSKIQGFKREFSLTDFEGEEVFFKLDASPTLALQALYKQAKRLKQRALNQALERKNLNELKAKLNELLKVLKSSNDLLFLKALFNKQKQRKKQEEFKGIQEFYFEDFKLLVGLNERANEELLKLAKKDDLWIHLKERKSPHVIIKHKKIKFSHELIAFGAKLCVEFSKVSSGVYLADYTARKNVRIKEKAFVNYVNYKSISVKKE